jgi:hypothetical protein
MPSGRHFFEPGQLRARPEDPFAAAEMAAAVAAVDAIDDSVELTGAVEVRGDRAAALAAEAAEAAEADESVALRISFLPEAEAATGFNRAPEATSRPEPNAPDAALAATAYSSTDAGDEVAAIGIPTGDAARPAESEALPVASVVAPAADPAGMEGPDTGAVLADSADLHDEEMSERDAETQALREAVAIVMGEKDPDRTDDEPPDSEFDRGATDAAVEAAAEPPEAGATDNREVQDATAAKTEPAANDTAASPVAPAPAETSVDAPMPHRKKGLFRRFRGN